MRPPASVVLLIAILCTGLPSESQDQTPTPPAQPSSRSIVLPPGTRLPLVLTNAISTRTAKPGDPVYFETLFPVAQEGRIIIPAGSFVQGKVVNAKRAGRIKGRAEVLVRMNQLVLPNAYVVSLNAVPTGAGTGENDDVKKEGTIEGDTDRLGDASTLVRTTAVGGGFGSIVGVAAGNVARGAGIGLGAGLAVGVLNVLLTRGPEVELARGTSVDVQLDRPLTLDASRINFTEPGRASALSGPPDRRPVRAYRFP